MDSSLNHGPAYDVILDKDNKIWVANWNEVFSSSSRAMEKAEEPKPPISKIVDAPEGLYAIGPKGIWLNKNYTWKKRTTSWLAVFEQYFLIIMKVCGLALI